MVIGGASPEMVAIPELGVAPLDDPGTDLEDELCDELLNISPLPTIVSPLTDPVEALPVSPSLHRAPPVPAQPDPVPSVESQDAPLREADERPTLDLFPSSLLLRPTMIQPLPRLRRTSRMILDYCRWTVRLLWTSTLRRMGTCCWEIRRTYLSYHCRYCLFQCNRLRCLLARMSGLQCFNMGHNGHGINLYGVSMTLMGN